jgi:hypothetical protein
LACGDKTAASKLSYCFLMLLILVNTVTFLILLAISYKIRVWAAKFVTRERGNFLISPEFATCLDGELEVQLVETSKRAETHVHERPQYPGVGPPGTPHHSRPQSRRWLFHMPATYSSWCLSRKARAMPYRAGKVSSGLVILLEVSRRRSFFRPARSSVRWRRAARCAIPASSARMWP